MNELTLFGAMNARESETALLRQNERTERFGLTLTHEACARLTMRRAEALRETGRIEWGEGVLPPLALALCDSPYASQASWESTLGELMELFYHFKGACGERLGDDTLVCALAALFNGFAGGCAARIATLDGAALMRFVRTGEVERDD